MVDDNTKLAARDVNLVALVERYGIELHRHGGGVLAGPCPCPNCTAINDGFHIDTNINRWWCRKCNRKGWHDAVELVMRCERLLYPDAVAWLLGDSTPTPRIAKHVPAVQQQVKGWDRERSTAFLQGAQDYLWATDGMGDRARVYLESRGLDSATWLNFGLGVANVKTGTGTYAPAIVIPWYVRGELVSLAHRFLEAQEGQRYTRWGSAANRLYGNHANMDSADTLIVCEGEINAMSIWQVAHHTRLHVLSTGKQVDRLSDNAVKAIADRYITIIVWADEQTVTNSLQQQLAAQAKGMVGAMYSPMQDGQKQDANTQLQRRELGATLAEYRLSIAQQQQQQQRLYSDLLQGAMSLQGLDAGSATVLHRLAAQLGKPIAIEQAGDNRYIVFGDLGRV